MNYYLITWKPENSDYSVIDYELMRMDFKTKDYVDTKWRLRSKDAKEGDGLILFRQGKITGVFGFGYILDSKPIETLENSFYYKVQFTNLRDNSVSPFISKNELVSAGIPKSLLNSESSGYGSIRTESIDVLNKLCIKNINFELFQLCNSRHTKW